MSRSFSSVNPARPTDVVGEFAAALSHRVEPHQTILLGITS